MTMTKTTFNTFKDFYEGLPGNKKAHFVADVMQTCEISEATFYRRLNNPTLFKPLEIAAIKNIATVYNCQEPTKLFTQTKTI